MFIAMKCFVGEGGFGMFTIVKSPFCKWGDSNIHLVF